LKPDNQAERELRSAFLCSEVPTETAVPRKKPDGLPRNIGVKRVSSRANFLILTVEFARVPGSEVRGVLLDDSDESLYQ
jgi:hypothetical protein